MKAYIEDIIKTKYNNEVITKSDIATTFSEIGMDLTDTGLRQEIHKLIKKGILQSTRRGVYSLNVKDDYSPVIDYFINKVRTLFIKNYSEINYCIWSTHWLNDFMIHQPFHWFYIFETEADMLESAFNLFKSNGLNAFINPDKSVLENYVTEEKRSIVIRKITSRSPLKAVQNNKVPTLEKILVDTFCDKDLFYFYHGNELTNIFRFADDRFKINYSLLLRYADIRERKKLLIDFLSEKVKINEKLLK